MECYKHWPVDGLCMECYKHWPVDGLWSVIIIGGTALLKIILAFITHITKNKQTHID